ncbi:hypothetical protein BD408DRAFT_342904 [Parasitella parasitica]|nr:hypothetical protein BD408DRAFT_342904 [Parasitella parasitica]
METLINLRLDKYEHDKLEFERQTEELDDADYHLLGALMVRYDSTASRGSASRSWCLYLRDYIEDEDGSTWRILLEDGESRVVSDQTLADIRGARENKTSPSEFSRDYRPVYLFYGNLDISQTSQMDDQNGNNVITLEDYTFDDEYDQDQLLLPQGAREEEEACKHCGIKDIVEDINDIFFCESCNQGVHQLCEEPPVEAFEKDVDPWYCRSCCKAQNIPVPSLPQLRDAAIYDENILKRKRKEDHTTCEDAGSLEKKT